MGTLRFHTRVPVPPDEVWQVLSVVDHIPRWFPGIDKAVFDGTHRILTLANGATITARVLTSDPDLRRFQYSFVDGMPVPIELHIGTIDVIEDGTGSLIVYSQQFLPEALRENIEQAVEGGIDGISRYFSESDQAPTML